VAIASTVLMLSPGIPGQIKPILGSTYFSLSSAMACRVFRAVLLGHIKDPQVTVAKITSVVSAGTNNQHCTSDDYTTTSRYGKYGLSSNSKIGVAIEMDRKVDTFDGYTLWESYSPVYDIRSDGSHRV